ncbi:MAG: hypothetical protein LBE79_05540 [Tannerella sp.]|jgi:hypothetical protein|nr:hypothetical protein [Tannerella sp.]
MHNITRIYRKLFCRKGYGVHSPFVFDFITFVIEEKYAYYAYRDISRVKLQMIQNNRFVSYRGKKVSTENSLRRFGISTQEGEFLFRLTNYLQPRKILSTGSSMGLTSLYLTRYSSNVQCITLENEPGFAQVASQVLNREANQALHILTGNYPETIRDAIVQLQQIDCLYIGKDVSIQDWAIIFEQCLPFIHDTFFCVMAGIRSSHEKLYYWKQFLQHPRITVVIDMFDLGLLFFQPKLHKRVYQTILP